jgi:hypothetical protein
MEDLRTDECNVARLRSMLIATLNEAERCDPVVAAYIETALVRFEDLYPQPH